MTNSISKVPIKQLVHSDKVQQMLQDTLQDKASQFAKEVDDTDEDSEYDEDE